MPAEQRMEWPTYAVSCTDEGGATVVAADKDDVFPGKFGPMWQESPALGEIVKETAAAVSCSSFVSDVWDWGMQPPAAESKRPARATASGDDYKG